MKRAMGLIIGLVLLLGMVSIAQAATGTQDIAVKVTVTAVLSVSVDRNEYNFGSHSTSVTTVSTQAITVTNDSTSAQESYQLNGTNSSPTNWTLASAPAMNTFELRAVFEGTSDSDQPLEADFHAGNDDLATGSGVYCTITQFAVDGSPVAQQGINVDTSAVRYLWFLMKTPTFISVGSATEQTSTVTITAAYPE
jgi:hypothetical protein